MAQDPHGKRLFVELGGRLSVPNPDQLPATAGGRISVPNPEQLKGLGHRAFAVPNPDMLTGAGPGPKMSQAVAGEQPEPMVERDLLMSFQSRNPLEPDPLRLEHRGPDTHSALPEHIQNKLRQMQ